MDILKSKPHEVKKKTNQTKKKNQKKAQTCHFKINVKIVCFDIAETSFCFSIKLIISKISIYKTFDLSRAALPSESHSKKISFTSSISICNREIMRSCYSYTCNLNSGDLGKFLAVQFGGCGLHFFPLCCEVSG